MILKASLTLLAIFLPALAMAELNPVSIVETSSSGKIVRINLGLSAGLEQGDPVLFRENDKRIAAGRVLSIANASAVVSIVETYGGAKLSTDSELELLYGETFDEAANLTDYVTDRDTAPENPANEKFFTAEGDEIEDTPELDDENYSPEISLRPKMPDSKTYTPHNITVGVGLFRNKALSTNSDVVEENPTKYTTYQGYALRYAYTFRTFYWFRQRTQALVSVEATWGVYNFDHTFAGDDPAQVTVMPIGFNLRYQIETSKIFRIYPYIGYQNNIVGATNGRVGEVNALSGGRLLGGIGAQLVMSNSVDARLEGGSDGVLIGLVAKF